MRYKEFLDELKLSYESQTFEVFPDTEVLWFEETSTLFIRGSDSLLDWSVNLLFIPERLSGFHLGFFLKAREIFKKCVTLGIKPTTVVGHSSGGAIAQRLGHLLDVESYSLACPKTVIKTKYNDKFFKWADDKLVIINQEKDIISKMPPFLNHPIEPLVLNTEDYFLFAHSLISFE